MKDGFGAGRACFKLFREIFVMRVVLDLRGLQVFQFNSVGEVIDDPEILVSTLVERENQVTADEAHASRDDNHAADCGEGSKSSTM